MTENRQRDRNVRWRAVGDKIAHTRVARWMARRGTAKATTRRTRQPVPTPLLRAMAWGVHFYTALGAVCAAAMLVLLVEGGPYAFRGTFALMLLATAIDATDGTLARRVRVKDVLPNFDGRRLDDLVDWLTYTCLPLMLIWKAEILPAGQNAWLLVPLLASAYGFCQVSIKTDDGYFLGFPSLWNVVAMYLYFLDLPATVALGIVILLAVMTFVPTRYLYPSSRPGLINKISNLGGAAWSILLVAILWMLPGDGSPGNRVSDPTSLALVMASLAYPLWYMGVSLIVTMKIWWERRVRLANAAN